MTHRAKLRWASNSCFVMFLSVQKVSVMSRTCCYFLFIDLSQGDVFAACGMVDGKGAGMAEASRRGHSELDCSSFEPPTH